MIRFLNVVVRYPGTSSPALDGVSFDALEGKITAVAGPNGSGKSTLIRALIRRQPIERGSIDIGGADLYSLSGQETARRIAVTPQREEPAFPMTVDEYVGLGRFPRLGLWRTPGDDDRSAAAAAMTKAGVAEFSERRTDTLSGGEWQRVRIARALAQNAKAIVLDEPTTFLDLSHEMSLFELLHSLAADGMAVLLVSHQLNLVARFADSIVLLHHGKVVVAGTPGEVMQASLLERVYEWPLVIARDPAVGAPSLVPLRRSSTNR